MPLSPRCECGHEFFMHHGAGNFGDQAGGCSGTFRKKPTGPRSNCSCNEYKPVTDDPDQAA